VHYVRWKKYGDVTVNKKEKPFVKCSVEQCEKRAKTNHDLCKMHLGRLEKYGDVNYDVRRKVKIFIENLVNHQDDNCLIWPFDNNTGWRPTVNAGDRTTPASCYVCQIIHGTPPTNKHEAAHSCGNGHLGCINPRHLRWATRSENQEDRIMHGTSNRGERNGVSSLTEEDVRNIRLRLDKKHNQYDIAKDFSVDQSTISNIKTRKIWGWLK
jgi:hypothetical protein